VKTDAKAATETAGKKGDAPATKTTPAATPTTSSRARGFSSLPECVSEFVGAAVVIARR